MQIGNIVQLTTAIPDLNDSLKRIELSEIGEIQKNFIELERRFNELQSLYERVSSDRLIYIHLWEQVPVKQRLAIHKALNKEEGLFQEL